MEDEIRHYSIAEEEEIGNGHDSDVEGDSEINAFVKIYDQRDIG